MATTQTNTQFSINYRDLLRGLLVSAITAGLTALLSALQAGGVEKLDWKTIGVLSLTAGVSYLVKNFFTPSEVVATNASDAAVKAVKDGAPIQVNGMTVATKSEVK